MMEFYWLELNNGMMNSCTQRRLTKMLSRESVERLHRKFQPSSVEAWGWKKDPPMPAMSTGLYSNELSQTRAAAAPKNSLGW